MANSAAASGSSFACSAFSYERAMPQVSGSLRMNFFAFGFGVSSMSAILGIAGSGSADRRVHRIVVRFGRRARDRVERGVQRVPRQDRAFDARRQVAHAGEHREPAEMVRGPSGPSLPVAMSRNSRISVSASARVLPLTPTVIIDADALQIAQDSP